MAWFSYTCPTHGVFRCSLDERSKTVPCSQCGSESKPVIKIGTSKINEVLDNGIMGRRVERLADIEEIMNDRADKNTAETTEQQDEDEE